MRAHRASRGRRRRVARAARERVGGASRGGHRARGRRGDGRRRRSSARTGYASGEPETDPRARGRRARGRVASRDPRSSLRRADRHAAPRVHADRPARVEAVVPPLQRLLRAVGDAAGVRADPGRRHRLGSRRGPSRPRGEDPRREELRRRVGARRHASATGPSSRVSSGAGVDNGIGIAGLAPSAELLVAKVVTKSRTIPVEAEAKAIRWAVDNGARVINMSLGGVRDPLDPERDTYSRLEADAVAYAVSNGVVVVAAVGNSDQAPTSPWKYASYPAALPHVLGVSATSDTGGIPTFSNRDSIYNDLAAPGLEILSILPRPLTARFPQCTEQGYSSCGPEEYREAQGTSFAAPQVAAAAAVLLSLRPTLRPEQVTSILQSTAIDLDVDDRLRRLRGRSRRVLGLGPARRRRRDRRARRARCPPRDFYETNDDLGTRAYPVSGSNRRLRARRRLLGRPGRRLRDPPEPEPAGVRRADGLGHDASTSASPSGCPAPARSSGSRTSATGCERRLARGRGSTCRTGRGSPGRTTSRCACRARARRATGSRSSRADLVATRPRRRRLAGLRAERRPGTSRSTARGSRRRSRAAGRPSSRPRPHRRTPPRRSRPRGRGSAPPPTRAPRRIVGPFMSSCRRSVRPMKLSFVVTTQGAMKTCSSSVE